MSIKISEKIKKLSPYVPENYFHENKNNLIKMDWNEYLGPDKNFIIEKIVESLKSQKGKANYYADLECKTLKKEISNFLKIEKKSINVYNGSDSALENIYKTFLDINDQLVIVGPTYDNARSLSQYYSNLKPEIFLFENPFKININSLKNLNHAKCIYICSPNNPTGTVFSKEELDSLAKKLPSTLIVIDEAYVEFSGKSLLNLCDVHDNIIIVRTFSKAFGLAGLRLGYTVSSPAIAKILAKTRNGKEVNSLAQVAGIACLENIESMYSYVEEVKKARDFTLENLSNQGFNCRGTEANYILIKLDNPQNFVSSLRTQNILVRNISKLPQMEGYVRVTIGSMQVMESFIEIINDSQTKLF